MCDISFVFKCPNTFVCVIQCIPITYLLIGRYSIAVLGGLHGPFHPSSKLICLLQEANLKKIFNSSRIWTTLLSICIILSYFCKIFSFSTYVCLLHLPLFAGILIKMLVGCTSLLLVPGGLSLSFIRFRRQIYRLPKKG